MRARRVGGRLRAAAAEEALRPPSMLLPVLKSRRRSGRRSWFVLAEDVEGEALATLVVNRLRGGLKVAAVDAHGLRRSPQGDAGSIAGGRRSLISDELGMKLESVTVNILGRARKVVIEGKHHDRQRRRQEKGHRGPRRPNQGADRGDHLGLRPREVAGASCQARRRRCDHPRRRRDRNRGQGKKDHVEDALNATRAAVQEGIVPGGGVALLRPRRPSAASTTTIPTSRPASTSC